jgi:XTP/dITP diphosphohydrolase
MRIVVATSNRGKLSELRALLPDDVHLVTSAEIGLPLPDETGSDIVENALLKARAAAQPDAIAVADDSGLMVDALGGAPGIFSARFAGQHATDDQNNCKLIELLAGLEHDERSARFCSAVAVVTPDGREYCATGTITGIIVEEPRGMNGFGYDPHFEIDDQEISDFNGRTMAEISLDQKNQISHRARAYRNLLKQLEPRKLFGEPNAENVNGEKNAADGVNRR